jgi:hypothetical protein
VKCAILSLLESVTGILVFYMCIVKLMQQLRIDQ